MTHWHEVKKVWQYLKGYLCFLFGAPISWNIDAFHEGLWLKALLAKICNIQLNAATHVIDDPNLWERLMMMGKDFRLKFTNEHLIDNKGLNDKVKKFGSNPKTHHINLKTKGIRQEVKHKSIRISLIKTSEMIADTLTRASSNLSVSVLAQAIDSDFNFD
ncbi:hypothetical protein VP01_11498g1 [Puccinia sorghi]|uniref:Uncharacterized protein n=1 Tax=Puccinia sorghi TaxID=27349 RepID=A0A0L6VRT2_9BASI|nr:hypothetical protein VP01_11498g1 [Puccinia sorghi]